MRKQQRQQQQQQPLISIILPIYNVQDYLDTCLVSIIDQTYGNWECICINDGSTDNSKIILDKYANEDERFKVYYQTNKGVSNARNRGIENALGDYMTFIDSDDWVDKYYLEKLYNNIIEYSSDFSACGYIDIGLDIQDNKNIPTMIFADNPDKILNMIGWRRVTAKLFRREVIVENKLKFNEDLVSYEDSVFMTELRFKVKCASATQEGLYYVLHHIKSATKDKSREKKKKESIIKAKRIINAIQSNVRVKKNSLPKVKEKNITHKIPMTTWLE
jgi:glycosyltransferase involved in cell wall biosynthesis